VTVSVVLALVAAFVAFAGVWVDVLWYDQAGFTSGLYTQWIAGGIIGVSSFFLMSVLLWLSLNIAYRTRPLTVRLSEGAERYRLAIEPIRKLVMHLGPLVVGVFAAIPAASNWPIVVQWLNKTSFGQTDPQFGLDVSFYVYDLPMYQFVVGQIEGALLVSLLAGAAAGFLYGGVRISANREIIVSKPFRAQIAISWRQGGKCT
jgi:uncharacterized membrane protein (UPF0182 family)